MDPYVCELTNNSPDAHRVVIISQFASDDFDMVGEETQEVALQAGEKVLIAWDATSGQLVNSVLIKVSQRAAFKVFSGSNYSLTAPDIYTGDPLPDQV
jgi:hypothetical protein